MASFETSEVLLLRQRSSNVLVVNIVNNEDVAVFDVINVLLLFYVCFSSVGKHLAGYLESHF